ncbi:MAG: tellurium resistance protein TerC [Myxococcales bacterium]|nr:tellurium resistance protein TerC [Myxococcales bacterium]
MADLFNVTNLANLGVLLFLQAVLGFDNLLYISIESQRAPAEHQKSVRRNAILIAIVLRIAMLFAVVHLVEIFSEPFFHLDFPGIVEGGFNFSVLVFLGGGAFIMYTAVREISHMLSLEQLDADVEKRGAKSVAQVTAMLVLMNLIFSFDSILSALAITKVFPVLTLAIIGSGLAMMVLADHVSSFLKRNRQYEVLGLFILLIVGVVLLGEGGHTAHLKLFGYPIEPLSKTTFYFSMAVLVLVDIAQGRYQKKLSSERSAQAA